MPPSCASGNPVTDLRRASQEDRGRESQPQWPVLDPPRTYLNFPLEPHGLTSRTTPVRDLFVLAHLGVPRIDPTRWSLSIDGLVERPLTLRLEDLKALPQRTVEAFLQCAGNPATPTVPARLIANVRWRGVDLATLLDAAGVAPRARFVWTYGLDRGEFMGVASGSYLKDLPIERARTGDVLIAFELNGEALSAEHGFPARLVVPGFYGTNSVKWLYRIELASERARGPFTTTFYNDPIAAEPGSQAHARSSSEADGRSGAEPRVESGREPRSRPVWSVAPESVIVSPAPGAIVSRAGGPRGIEVWGWAWGDAPIAAVELSFDAGGRWSQARLDPPRERSWQRFSIEWWPAAVSGEVELQCRATDATGRAQPLGGARNAVHKVSVKVAEAM